MVRCNQWWLSITRDIRTCSVVRRQWRTRGLLVVGKRLARPVVLTGPRTARERPDDPPLSPSLIPERALCPIRLYYACQGFCNHQKVLLLMLRYIHCTQHIQYVLKNTKCFRVVEQLYVRSSSGHHWFLSKNSRNFS